MEGLMPGDYRLSEIELRMKNLRLDLEKGKSPDTKDIRDLDFLLTESFFMYCSHILYGKIDPASVEGNWSNSPEDVNILEVLTRVSGSGSLEEEIKMLRPQHKGYDRLVRALAEYRKIARVGGFSSISYGPPLNKGDRGERVLSLKARLIETGDLKEGVSSNDDVFDESVEQAVKVFQERHRLKITGAVDYLTLSDLNMPVEGRIRQIELNLERWRWLPRDFGMRHIFVDIAGFEMEVVEDLKRVMKSPIIVGQPDPDSRTPAFSANMTYLVLNPSWCMPTSIMRREMLPKIRKNPDFLKEANIKVTRSCGLGQKEIDPETIDWSNVDEKRLNFRLVQLYGPANPLGRVKFIFPNKYAVYIHDTPQRELFDVPIRSFSHGCIRTQKPFELAEYLLRPNENHTLSQNTDKNELKRDEDMSQTSNIYDYDIDLAAFEKKCMMMENLDWARLNIIAAIEDGIEQILVLPTPISVHLIYLTTWVNEDNTVHFRTDIYGFDRLMDQVLREELIDSSLKKRTQAR